VRRGLAFARIALTGVALWLVALWVDAGDVLARLTELKPSWVALALAISVVQVLILAWRWRFTALRLGLDISLRDALGEYYLGILINQVLPGGVMGDVTRAWRHAHATALTGPAVRAVILERVSAQVVMVLAALVSLAFLPGLAVWAAAGALVSGGVAIAALRHEADDATALGRIRQDARRACLAPDAVALQAASAVAVVGSYIAVFVVAARAVGVSAPLGAVLPLVAPVLMTMLIPVTVAGWGVREAAAAALWGMVGLAPGEGAAVSVAYGLLVLASSAPGALVLMRTLSAGRDRRARPHPE